MRRGLLVVVVAAVALAAFYGIRRWQASASVEAAVHRLAAGEPAAAVRGLLPVVAASPGDARTRYYLGLAYLGIGARAGALRQLQEAVRLAPAEPRFHDGLGQVYRETGRADLARREFEEAIRRDAAEPRYHADVAGLLLDAGQVAEAVEHLRQAVGLQLESSAARLLLASALRRLGDRDGMAREYRQVMRRARGTALAEIAYQELRALEPGTAR